MISLRLRDETEKLKADFQQWLKSNPPPTLPGRVSLEHFVEVSRAWQKKLAQDAWVGLHWPEEFGGRGASITDEAVIQECLAEANAPQLINLFGLTMVGPVLIRHGTEAQKKRYLRKILTAEEIWCQGFSEPEAGSDLASIKTKGEIIERDGKIAWEVSGQKIWTSFAQVADCCFLLVRTDPNVSRYAGLSYFLLSMQEQGIDVRPLTQISGDREFNELFLDRVRIPTENIVGKEGDGWSIAISTLMYERVVLTFARHLQSEKLLSEIRLELLKRGASESEQVTFGRLVAQSMAVRTLALHHLLAYEKGAVQPGPEGSLDKLGWSETFQEICRFGLRILGEQAIVTAGSGAAKGGLFQHEYLYSRGRTIAAGTSEIQRNIIAERVLKLPREGKG